MAFWLALALSIGAMIAGGYLFRSAFRDRGRISAHSAVLRSVGGAYCMLAGAIVIAVTLAYA